MKPNKIFILFIKKNFNFFRHFIPTRGIDYLIDLDCDNDEIFERIQVSRPIHSTKLLEKVPYVKEDREIALLGFFFN